MQHALALARKRRCLASPNPWWAASSFAKQDRRRRFHQYEWRDHAGNRRANPQAKKRAARRSMSRSEPCNHGAAQAPCTEAIIAAGYSARRSGRWRIQIQSIPAVGSNAFAPPGSGVHGVCEEEARRLNRGLCLLDRTKKPFVTLKPR